MNGTSIFLTVLLLHLAFLAMAQQDTEFWFAAPDASATHEDTPIRLRLSTEGEPTQVTISQPANPAFTPYNISLPANSTQTVTLTSRRAMLEHSESGIIANKGLRIQSTAIITAYYEIGETFNIDIFTLKGKNALGQNFIAPGQTYWPNVNFNDARSTIELVATQNNTIVTLIPNADVIGHLAGDTAVIRLNRGQSYSLRKISRFSNETLAGSIIQSTKPIAVSVTDDSMMEAQCYDIGGDQIVPVGVLGKEYILTRGELNNNERIFITGTENGTALEITGNSSSLVDTIGFRETKMFITQDVMYIKSSHPVYVMQYTGIGCELGAALIPSVNCKGSNTISFTRSGNDQFYLKLLVRTGGESGFTINGNSSFIQAVDFRSVPGTSGNWKIAVKSFPTSLISPGSVYVVKNEGYSFQLGFLDGGDVTGARYGYFSNFSSLFIGDDLTLCEGDTWEIVPKGQPGSTYVWNDGSTGESLLVDSPGTYWVEMTNPTGCVLTDSLTVTEKTAHFLQLPDTLYGCEGEEFTYQKGRYVDYQWSNGLTSRTFRTDTAGTFTLMAVDRNGCEDSDSMQVLFHPMPEFSVVDSARFCHGDGVLIEAVSVEALDYEWSNGNLTKSLFIDEEGLYTINGRNEHCSLNDSVYVMELPSPTNDTIIGSKSVCPGVEDVAYWVDHSTDDWISTWWHVVGGSIDSREDLSITVDWEEANNEAMVQFVSMNTDGCTSDTAYFKVVINELLDTETPEGLEEVCSNATVETYEVMPTNGSIYEWQAGNGTILTGQGTSKVTVEWQENGSHELVVLESSTTNLSSCFGTSDPLEVKVFTDSARLWMNFVSVGVNKDDRMEIVWIPYNKHRVQFPVQLFRREGVDGQLVEIWEEENFNDHIDEPVNSASISYGYQLRALNYCNEEISSSIHQSMVLKGTSNEEETEISLSWNEYLGWDDGVEKYIVIRQLDDNTTYDTLAMLDGQTTGITIQNATDGFKHRLRIVAVGIYGTVSLSNHVEFEFKHELYIPNVITPNADNLNDFFVIPKIELYPEAELSIYNRQAQEVFSQKGYQNNFSASSLSAGTYYYYLNIPNLGRSYKGWISIMK